MMTLFDHEEAMKAFLYQTEKRAREEGWTTGRNEGRVQGRAEGRVEGRAEGKLEMLIGLVRDGVLPIAEASKRLGISEADFRKAMATSAM